jgi:hypothetical protein
MPPVHPVTAIYNDPIQTFCLAVQVFAPAGKVIFIEHDFSLPNAVAKSGNCNLQRSDPNILFGIAACKLAL